MTTIAVQPGRVGTRISAVGLTARHRGRVPALDDVSLDIEPGQLTAVIGPSGAGKSTLLAALAGVTPAQEGTVTFDLPDVTGREARVGFVPQDDILHGELPLRRTLHYAASLRMTAPSEEIAAAVDATMQVLGLADQGDVPVHSLSGGQRKRANIACEILPRPDVLFLDEPTSGLDPAAAADLVDCMQRMSAAGSTIAFTTHSVVDIEKSVRVVAVAPGGRLVAGGTPTQEVDPPREQTITALYQTLDALRRPQPARRTDVGP